MRRTKYHSVPAAVLMAAALALPAPAAGQLIIDTRNLASTELSEVIDRVRDADAVFVGESHENPHHHAAQLSVIKGLHDTGDRVAIGLEMFATDSQTALDDWTAGRIGESDFVPIFDRNWGGGSWSSYRGIFLYARQYRIPMVALNVDRRIVNQVARQGFQSVAEVPGTGVRNVRCDASERYQGFLREIVRRHGQGHGQSVRYNRFCEAQVLWDATMAWNLVDYLGKNPGRTVVVLSGLFHSWKHGIPERVRIQSSATTAVIVPSGPDSPFGHDLTREDADYIWWFEGGARDA